MIFFKYDGFFNFTSLSNAEAPIFTTESGIITDFNDVLTKATSSIFFKLFGNFIVSNAVQFANAPSPIVVIFFPNVTFFKFLHVSNVLSSITFT